MTKWETVGGQLILCSVPWFCLPLFKINSVNCFSNQLLALSFSLKIFRGTKLETTIAEIHPELLQCNNAIIYIPVSLGMQHLCFNLFHICLITEMIDILNIYKM